MTLKPEIIIDVDAFADLLDVSTLYRLLAAIETTDPRRDEAMQIMADAFDLHTPAHEKAVATRIAAGRAREAAGIAGRKEIAS